ncbi:MAG: glutathione S-transferase family protein [Lysobacteraceae bacterium]
MFDSPFTRRVAISATLLGFAFEHRAWSVGRDFDRIREYSPLGRVPVLVLDDGRALCESALILDWLDQQAGPERALLPAGGEPRLEALRLLALATGAADKGIHVVIERVFRPEDKRHAPWTGRCLAQVRGALAELDRACAARPGQWLVGGAMTQADITVACYATYLREALPLPLDDFPALRAHVGRCEALPVFARFHVPFDAPVPAPATA